MNLDFPLILVILTAVSGVMWLLDKLLLRRLRGEGVAPSWLVEFTAPFFPVLLVVLVLRSFLVEPFQIPSGSMIPTLKIGDFILVNKYAYGLRLPVTGTKILAVGEPQRGEVMVFFPPGDARYFIKRVVGIPGDHIRVKDNTLYVNGQKMSQTSVAGITTDPGFQVVNENLDGVSHWVRKGVVASLAGRDFSTQVPAGHYFMMGDNRDNSSDSRYWGPVPEANIVGKAVYVWLHWESLFSLPSLQGVGKIR